MKRIKLLQSFFVIFSVTSVRVRAIQLCCPEGEIYSKIGVEQTVSLKVKQFLKSLNAILKDRCEEILDKYGCVKTDEALPKSWASENTDRRFNLSGADAAY